VRTDRGSAFRRGCDEGDRVFAPRTVRLAIGEAAPQVDDRAAAHVDAACRADLAGVSLEVRPERIGDLPPAVLDVSLQHVNVDFLGIHTILPFRVLGELRVQDLLNLNFI
jgi:hypothetical protein